MFNIRYTLFGALLMLFCTSMSAQTTLGGWVFSDLNGNGLRDSGEPGIEGVSINFFDNGGTWKGWAGSAADGSYSVSLPTGAYKACFNLHWAYNGFSTANVGTNDNIDSDVVGSGSAGCTDLVTGSASNLDCGMVGAILPSCPKSFTLAYSDAVCNNNGTPSNPNDDTFTFKVTATLTSGVNDWGWSANNDGAMNHYGDAIPFGPYPISGGAVTLNVIDNDYQPSTGYPLCTAQTITIPAPATCSSVNNVCTTTRTITNNVEGASCANYSGPTYGMYFDNVYPGLGTGGQYFTFSNGTFIENGDGTATFTGLATSNVNANVQFNASVQLCGRTYVAPQGSPTTSDDDSPKLPSCYTANTSAWYYYTSVCGTLNGAGAAAGAVLKISQKGPAFQVGMGANLNESTQFGASSWFNITVQSQPSNGTVLTGTNGGDFNFRLSGSATPNTCGTGTAACQPCTTTPTTIAITCNNSISTAATSANGAVVTFNAPTATTTCSGVVSVTQTGGLASGSTFPVGTSTITYTATNACGQSTTCTFSVTVSSFTNNCTTTRTITNNVEGASCANYSGPTYGMYFDNVYPGLGTNGNGQYFSLSNGSLVENADGTATFTGLATSNVNANAQFNVSVQLCGRTFVAPQGSPTTSTDDSPKMPDCYNPNTSAWYYYTSMCGTLTGAGSAAGAVLKISQKGPAFQVGVGANMNESTQFGASSWFNITVQSQPSNGTVLTGTNGGDFNFRLSGSATPNTCGAGTAACQPCTTTPTTIAITCNSSISTAATSANGAVVTFNAPMATTTCSGSTTVTQTGGLASGSTFPVGTTTVTYTATNGCGQSTTCSFSVTVTPFVAPAGQSVGDFVFNDLNGNGIQDAGEPGVEGSSINIFNAAGNWIGWTSSNASGAYGFNSTTSPNLVPGQYKICFAGSWPLTNATIKGAGTDNTKDSDINPSTDGQLCTDLFTIGAGQNITNIDAGFTSNTPPPACSISAVATAAVCNNNNTPTVASDDTYTFSVTVNSNGNCTGTWTGGGTTGSYGVAKSFGPYAISAGNQNLTFTSASGQTTNVSVVAPATCSGTVVTNISINCPINMTMAATSANGAMVSFATPMATTNCAGNVTVTQTAGPASGSLFPVGTTTVTFSASNGCGNNTSCSFTVTVSPFVTPTGQSVGDFVFNDLNGNGIQDAGEPGVEGTSINIFNAAGNWIGWTSSNASGAYGFNSTTSPNLVPGQYKICFAGAWPLTNATIKGAGTDNTKDSDINPSTDGQLCTDLFTIGAGENITNIDAGLTGNTPPACAISATASAAVCNNNGTPSNPADDTYTVSVTVNNNGNCSGNWTSGSTSGAYGVPTTFGPYAISAGNQNLTITSASGQTTNISVTAPATCSNQSVCDNVTNAGSIAGAQTICAGQTPNMLTSTALPSGGTGTIEYIWLSAAGTTCPSLFSQAIAGSTSETYQPGALTQTTTFRRCARRSGCTDYVGESNCITITVVQPGAISAVVSNIVCNNNGTASNPADDTYTFSVTVSQTGNCATTWTGGGATGSFGTPVSFGPYAISAGNTTISITSNNGQTTSITAVAPATCSNQVVCSNVTGAGSIAGAQTICAGQTPNMLTSTALPSGGTGTIEYIWLSSAGTTCPSLLSQAIAGSTSATYQPGALTQTTTFRRCARRSGCTDYVGESNCITITVVQPGAISAVVSNIVCNNNGTASNPADDTYTFSVTVSQTGNCATSWTGGGASGSFGTPVSFGPYAISAGNTTISITSNNGQTTSITAVAPATCSNQVVCSNVTSAGSIAGAQTICAGQTPNMLTSSTLPSGGTGTIEYIWLSAAGTTCPSLLSQAIAGSTSSTYQPGALTQTTTFRRCARRSGCTDYVGESNCITITVVQPGAISAVVSNIVCNNNGTASNPADDTYTFSITVSQTGNCATSWTGGGASGSFGTPVSFGPFAISSGNKTVAITSNNGQTTSITAVAPATCSNVVVCSNITNGGTIAGTQTVCSGGIPALLTSSVLPSGGSGTIEYLWLSKVGTTCGASTMTQIPNSNSATYQPGALTQTTTFIRCSRRSGCTNYDGESNCITITVSGNCGSACAGTLGSMKREKWHNLSDSQTNFDAIYANSPTGVYTETQYKAPSNIADKYASRMRGFIRPSVSGHYQFLITGDDRTELWLNSSGTSTTGKAKICEITQYTGENELSKYSSQTSVSIYLNANTDYYIELRHREFYGGDHFNVRWKAPSTSSYVTIPGSRLKPWTCAYNALATQAGVTLALTQQPTAVKLQWSATNGTQNATFAIEKFDVATAEYVVLDYMAATQVDDVNKVFTYTDEQPLNGENRYRVRLIKLDNQEVASEPQSVMFNHVNGIQVYPNPTKGEVEVLLSNYEGNDVTISVTDVMGRTLLTHDVKNCDGTPAQLSLSELPDGTFFMIISANGFRNQTLPVVLRK